jgi:hypothetical protein
MANSLPCYDVSIFKIIDESKIYQIQVLCLPCRYAFYMFSPATQTICGRRTSYRGTFYNSAPSHSHMADTSGISNLVKLLQN